MSWKELLDKLRTIVLSAAAWDELDPETVEALDYMRRATRGEQMEPRTLPGTNDWGKAFVWEPFSDEKGEPKRLFGWELAATFYGLNGKPWWLVRAFNPSDSPSAQSIKDIEAAVDYFGAHIERDRIMNVAFGNGHGHAMWWTWLNQHPLLEVHIRADPPDLRVVPEGSFVKPGYERVERVSAKRPE
jgi:hypothetical protein